MQYIKETNQKSMNHRIECCTVFVDGFTLGRSAVDAVCYRD